MAEFELVQVDGYISEIRELFWLYLQWANARGNEEFGVNFDIEAVLEDNRNEVNIYFPPDGRLILTFEESKPAGLGCLKKLRNGMGEIKRMYIQPEYRGHGLGREVLKALLSEARDIGYSKVRLDSGMCQ